MWYRPLSFPTKKGKEKTCTYDLCIKKIKCKKWFHWWFLSPFCKNVLFMFDSHSWDNVKSYFCHNKNLNRHFQSCLLIIYHYHFSCLIQQHRIFLKLHINLLQYGETVVGQMAMWEKLSVRVADDYRCIVFAAISKDLSLHLINLQKMIKQQLTSAAARSSSLQCSRSHMRGPKSKFWGF